MGVGHQQPAVAVDGQSARAVDVEVGRPPAAEILAVAVEDLDPVGQVGEEQVVLGVERGGPRLVQMPGLDPVHSPDQVRLPTAPAGRSPPAPASQAPTAPAKSTLRVAFYRSMASSRDLSSCRIAALERTVASV